jgi:hypothetical protein
MGLHNRKNDRLFLGSHHMLFDHCNKTRRSVVGEQQLVQGLHANKKYQNVTVGRQNPVIIFF